MDYHLKPIGTTCAGTGESLEPNSICYSVLVELNGELARLDFSRDGWDGPPEGTLGQWRCLVPEPEQVTTRPLDTDGLMRYFEQLSESIQLEREPLRYVLSLLLLQKRRLKLEGSRIDGDTEVLEFVGSRGEGTFDVPDCRLTDRKIQDLQRELDDQLEREWS